MIHWTKLYQVVKKNDSSNQGTQNIDVFLFLVWVRLIKIPERCRYLRWESLPGHVKHCNDVKGHVNNKIFNNNKLSKLLYETEVTQ